MYAYYISIFVGYEWKKEKTFNFEKNFLAPVKISLPTMFNKKYLLTIPILFSRLCWSEELFLGRVYRIDKWVLRWYVLFLDDLIKRMQWYSFVIGFTLTCGRFQFKEPKRFENMFAMYITVSQQACTLNNQNVFSKTWTLAGYCIFAINFVSWRNSRQECLAGSGEASKDESGSRTSIFHYVTVDPERQSILQRSSLPLWSLHACRSPRDHLWHLNLNSLLWYCGWCRVSICCTNIVTN